MKPRTGAKLTAHFQNTTFNSALKQSTAIRKDLANLSVYPSSAADPASSGTNNILTPAALGSLSASLTTFQKTIDEYNSLAKQELNPAKQDKANERIRNFRTELAAYRKEVDALKAQRDEALHTQNRGELLGQRRGYVATPENPYANTSSSSGGGGGLHARNTSGGAGVGGSSSRGGGGGGGYETMSREDHAFREQNFFASTNSALDEYIARGQAVLGDLGTQRDMLKNTQKRYVPCLIGFSYSVTGARKSEKGDANDAIGCTRWVTLSVSRAIPYG